MLRYLKFIWNTAVSRTIVICVYPCANNAQHSQQWPDTSAILLLFLFEIYFSLSIHSIPHNCNQYLHIYILLLSMRLPVFYSFNSKNNESIARNVIINFTTNTIVTIVIDLLAIFLLYFVPIIISFPLHSLWWYPSFLCIRFD